MIYTRLITVIFVITSVTSLFAQSENTFTQQRIDNILPVGSGISSRGKRGGNFFKDKKDNCWGTFFGNDDQSPGREKPGL